MTSRAISVSVPFNRRQVLLGAGALATGVALGVGRARANPAWSYADFSAAMQASERPFQLSEATFAAVQARRQPAVAAIEAYLKSRFGEADPRTVKAFADVPRDYFHYNYAGKFTFANETYEANAKPWAIGFGSALSDYLGQAYMTQISKPGPEETVLEIGTGSGYQISILSRMVKAAYSIEIIEPLGKGVAKIFKPLGYDNVETRVGDGFFGWPEVKDGFDIIMVTCAAQFVPPELFRQLKPGGRLVIPVGQQFRGGQFLYIYTKDAQGKIHSRKDVGVFFIPMTGAIQRQPA